MTAVLFKFQHPDGLPVADATFSVSLRKPTFDEQTDEGIVTPGNITGVTDALGECTLEIVAGFGVYYLTMDLPGSEDSEGCKTAIRYKFVVPENAAVLRVEDLIVTTPTWSRPWDEQALALITEAKVVTLAAAEAAKDSAEQAATTAIAVEADALSAHTSAESAAADAVIAKEAAELAHEAIEQAQGAKEAAEEAKASAVLAGQHEEAAGASASAAASASTIASEKAAIAVTSAQATQVDAASALDSKNAAKASETVVVAAQPIVEQARDEAVAAKDQAVIDAVTASQAATSATASKDASQTASTAAVAAAAQVAADRVVVSAAAVQVSADADEVSEARTEVAQNTAEAKKARDEAVAAASIMTGALVELGSIDLSDNTYPPKPLTAGFWKVVGSGLIDGIDYLVGDTLVYSKTLDQFYKIDNTENVNSVNGQQGVVVLTKTDIGLSAVNNTSDLAKPISTAQQSALDGKEPVIAKGNNAQYWTGDKTWSSLSPAVRTVTLAGLVLSNTALAETDSFLVGFGKLQGQLNNKLASTGKAADSALLNGQPASFYTNPDVMTGATATVAGTSGLTPVPSAGDQIKFLRGDGTYAEVAAGASLPVGAIQPWGLARATLPAGWIARDGQLLNRSDWPDLWALVSASAVTDTVWLASPYDQRGKYSSGNGTTTFRMPDTNAKHADGNTIAAMVLRGDGKNSAGTPGLHQADQLGPMMYVDSVNDTATTVYIANAPSSANAAALPRVTGVGQRPPVTQASNGTKWITNTGNETRSANETVIWCTVGAGKAVNPGTVDVTALATTVSNQSNQIQAIQTKTTALEFGYISPNTSFSNGTTVTLNHGLGSIPARVDVDVLVVTAQHGYAAGSIVSYGPGAAIYIVNTPYGFSVSKTATTISLMIASGGFAVVSGASLQAFSPANILLQVRASRA